MTSFKKVSTEDFYSKLKKAVYDTLLTYEKDPYEETRRAINYVKNQLRSWFKDVKFGDTWNYGKKGGGFDVIITLESEVVDKDIICKLEI